MAEYDKIAKEYSQTQEKRLARELVYDYSLFKNLGDIKGKSVLDLACGDGRLTRRLKKLGASKVIGIDLSSEMIKIAKEKEEQNPLGITYKVGKVGEIGKIGDFDVVVAGFLLHYSQTKEEIQKMADDISMNLKQGGKFLTLNNNPFSPTTDAKKYGSTIEFEKSSEEGSKIIVRLWTDEKEVCKFDSYFWKKETYEEQLKKGGLKDIKWIPVEVSEDGINKFETGFWDDFYKNPTIILIEATK
jgi:toxoflavin synthase